VTAAEQAARTAVILTARAMSGAGLTTGTAGNVSVRAGQGFLITPSARSYDTLAPDDIVAMDLDGRYVGPLLPSSEWRMHEAIYRGRAEAGAVVHTHSTYAAALSALRQGIPAFHYMVAVAGGPDIRCADYATFGTAELCAAMLVALEGRRACLLANHGVICFADDPPKALALAIEVEALARQYLLARQAGTPTILGEDEMAVVIERFRTYGRQPEDLSDGERLAFDPPVRRDGNA
jgi:L-fuculose-phosphate aldolase